MKPVKNNAKQQRPRLPFSMITTVVLIIVLFLIWRPVLFGQKSDAVKAPIEISQKDFVPADSNKDLTDGKRRLIIVTDVHATALNSDRSRHIYLPLGYYDHKDRSYPVLYVNDGKSVFENSDWSGASLDMHKTADQLILDRKIEGVIIVGVDNIGENRLGEYALWDGVDQGKPVTAVGEKYEDFLLDEVKPFIDQNFRTLPDRDNTAMMGQSMGGFSAFNIVYRHPEVFGKLAMQSPYLDWGDNKLYGMLRDGPYKEKQPLKIWLDVGSKEGSFVDTAAQDLYQLMNNGYQYGSDLLAYEAPDGEHSEKFWSYRVKSILLYFYGDIGKPASVTLYSDKEVRLGDSYIKHINAVVTYDSGLTMTDISGSYSVQKPEVLKVDTQGGAMYPLAEGSTEVTYTTPTGLSAKTTITVVK